MHVEILSHKGDKKAQMGAVSLQLEYNYAINSNKKKDHHYAACAESIRDQLF